MSSGFFAARTKGCKTQNGEETLNPKFVNSGLSMLRGVNSFLKIQVIYDTCFMISVKEISIFSTLWRYIRIICKVKGMKPWV